MSALTKHAAPTISARINGALAGVPDRMMTIVLLGAAGVIAYLAFALPPAGKPALLAYIILP